MTCAKIPYPSPEAAREAMRATTGRLKKSKRPTNPRYGLSDKRSTPLPHAGTTYRCSICGHWHWSSLTRDQARHRGLV